MEGNDVMQLKMTVSRLHRLGVANLATVLNLSQALLSADSLTPAAREAAQMAFDSIQEQIDLLKEIGEIEGDVDVEQ
ncbi:hypothetical protein GE543_04045 [Pseudomonas sp. SZ57]|uniref:Uncharacterized protein n=1 Tax=Pseudomonas syringae pv. coryli TaxID=317659 RepID=A0A0N8R6I1_9PSED|nr:MULTISPECIES: hypothetical protein [Pseudomonas]KPW98054.1 Uncharacterized protein ALO75_01695 [Pseudomonas syringae pv. coryli]MCF8983817.1 hypothetical protein [Pseudomonas syringae]MCF9003498.1 hypothetical protein [Pseudomonas syringae]MQQ33549.1 hypothetical protein [Pseudomonas sp. SZ57]POP74236.1 hypothetical protein CXB37_19920 [Pseudomonas syringae pv. syringae]